MRTFSNSSSDSEVQKYFLRGIFHKRHGSQVGVLSWPEQTMAWMVSRAVPGDNRQWYW